MEVVVEKSVAEAEFQRFAESWDVDTDVLEMSEDDQQGFAKVKRTLLRVIMSGNLTIDEAGNPKYTLRYPNMTSLTELEFQVPVGGALLEFDKFKDRENIRKIMAYMGNFTGKPDGVFAKMDTRDVKICQAVALLFLATT